MLKHYIIINFGGVGPELRGPYKSDASRVRAARRYRRNDYSMRSDYMRLTIHPGGEPEVESFYGSELREG